MVFLIRSHGNDEYDPEIDIGWRPQDDSLTQAISNLKALCTPKGEEQEEEAVWMRSIHTVLYRLWSQPFYPTPDNPVPDPTVHYLMLRSVGKDGRFMEASEITPTISKFKYALRLTMVYELNEPMFIQNLEDPHARSAQIEMWIHEKKTDSTFNTLCSLKHRASSIAQRTMSYPQFYWPDYNDPNELIFRGDRLRLEDIRTMIHKIEDKLVKTFEEDVMMGLKFATPRGHIADDLANHDPGYSFLNDARNPFESHRATLLKRIVRDAGLRTRFTYVTEAGEVKWRIRALESWISAYSSLSQLLLLRCELLMGGPGRGTELTAMQYRSTTTRGIRNLCIFGKHIVMVRTYGKTSAMMGKDRVIPHSLDGVTGDVLLQDLVYARPFAEFVVSILYPDDLDLRRLYYNNVFVNTKRLFNTNDVSNEMSRWTTKFVGVSLKVRQWRHISIALRRKLCPSETMVLEDDLGDTVAAEQAGHSLETERRIYAVSQNSLIGPAEHIVPLFLHASGEWQHAMETVPGEIKLYISVKMSSYIISRWARYILYGCALYKISIVCSSR